MIFLRIRTNGRQHAQIAVRKWHSCTMRRDRQRKTKFLGANYPIGTIRCLARAITDFHPKGAFLFIVAKMGFKVRKLRQKALKLSGWYKTRWDKPKGWVMRMNVGIIRSECHRNGNKQLPGYWKGYELLKRYEGKLSCTVLRRREVGNRFALSRR